MDPTTKEVIEIVNAIKPELWWILFKMSGVAVIVLILKKV